MKIAKFSFGVHRADDKDMTEEDNDSIWDAIIDFAEKKGYRCGGGSNIIEDESN